MAKGDLRMRPNVQSRLHDSPSKKSLKISPPTKETVGKPEDNPGQRN